MNAELGEFVNHVVESGLLGQDELTGWISALPASRRPKSGEQLARELVRQGKLTVYQAQQLYQGKGKSLVLGNYTVLDQLGKGGMGVVYKAEHRRMHRLVALKVLSPKATKSSEAVKRFHREAEAAARLIHPHIVTAFDADEAGGTHFLVMEYVEGSDLSSLVKKEGPLPVETAVDYIVQAARGRDFGAKGRRRSPAGSQAAGPVAPQSDESAGRAAATSCIDADGETGRPSRSEAADAGGSPFARSAGRRLGGAAAITGRCSGDRRDDEHRLDWPRHRFAA